MDRVLRFTAAGLVLAGGLVHFQLWSDGYKDFPNANLGRSFLLNAAASIAVAVALAVWRHWLTVLAALAVVNGTLIAFALSRTDRGIFGFTETGWTPAPEAVLALVFEVGAATVLLIALWARTSPATGEIRAQTM
jgi:hypothetical protein